MREFTVTRTRVDTTTVVAENAQGAEDYARDTEGLTWKLESQECRATAKPALDRPWTRGYISAEETYHHLIGMFRRTVRHDPEGTWRCYVFGPGHGGTVHASKGHESARKAANAATNWLRHAALEILDQTDG